MNNTLQTQAPATYSNLYLAFELSGPKWQLVFSNGFQQRITAVENGDWMGLQAEILIAKKRLRCAEDSQVYSCYEAKRQGFWFHHALLSAGINNFVVGPVFNEAASMKSSKTAMSDEEIILQRLMQRVSGDRF